MDKFLQRGRVFEFLEKIECTGYRRIDEVYVPPSEYNDIVKTLNEKRIVFITGTQEYGKTYTAVRLMWEYYNKGYAPKWIKGGEQAERTKARERLENIISELKSGHIIYFEDPFGKTKYEKREGLEREIGTILERVGQVRDVYIVVTSREEVFKEFVEEKLSESDLQEFEKQLNIKKPSYDYEKRKEILLLWAKEENCNWLKNQKLKKLVLYYLKNKRILPTPLSIRNFAIATTGVKEEDKLEEIIEEKSKETAKAFAQEIENMTHDKVLFLSFLFISNYFEVGFVKRIYQDLVKELNLSNAWEFDRVFNWFNDDKININQGYIEFSHPAYAEALKYLLIKNGCITKTIKEIFSKLILILSENAEAAIGVARTVVENFDTLSDDVRNLLFKLSEKNEAAEAVAQTVVENFDGLPDDFRNKLLLSLSEKNEAARVVARTVVENYDKLPDDVSNLLFKLSEKNEAAEAVAQ
ncbi:MAG: hypothetical protein AABY84_08160, partial [Candidatus Firestonebacteria bacterium]